MHDDHALSSMIKSMHQRYVPKFEEIVAIELPRKCSVIVCFNYLERRFERCCNVNAYQEGAYKPHKTRLQILRDIKRNANRILRTKQGTRDV